MKRFANKRAKHMKKWQNGNEFATIKQLNE